MKIINLHGVVGVHINAKDFAEEINSSEGDITLDLNSGGGFVTDGVAILNSIRSYDKGKVTARVSYAASMMTQIALAADEVQVYDNSIFMIHNAMGVAVGDYREMDRRGKMLQSMTNMLSNIYVKKTGKPRDEILQMMNDETYLYGAEIQDEGFADTLLEHNDDSNLSKDDAINVARDQLEAVKAAMEKENLSTDQLEERIAACAAGCNLNSVENGATTFKDLPMVNRPWDSAAAVQRVRRFLNAQDAPNVRYKEAFFWYNAEEPDLFGSYKLPFVDIVDGRLVAIVNAVNAANGAMSGARGNRVDIPSADRPRVQALIDRYREKWQREQENRGEGGDAFLDNPAEGGEVNRGVETMTLDELKANHPALFAAAVDLGVKQEQDRVNAHVTLGQETGATDYALECIQSGVGMTNVAIAKYTAHGMNRNSQTNREEEAPGDLNTPPADTLNNDDEELANAVGEALGTGRGE